MSGLMSHPEEVPHKYKPNDYRYAKHQGPSGNQSVEKNITVIIIVIVLDY